jgi:hypothetical protein
MGEPLTASIWILPLGVARNSFPLVQSRAVNGEARFSPDCKWVAYRSNESGQVEVFVTRFPDAARKYQVSTEGGTDPHWGSGGNELFYFSPQRKSLMTVRIKERGQELILDSPHELFSVTYGSVPARLFDVTQDGQRFLVLGPKSSAGVPLTLVTNWGVELNQR